MDDRFEPPKPLRGTARAHRSVRGDAAGGCAGSWKRWVLLAAVSLSSSAVAPAADPRPRPLPPIDATASPGAPDRAAITPADSFSPIHDLARRQRLAALASSQILEQNSDGFRQPPPTPLVESMTIDRLLRRSAQLTVDAELALRRGAVRSSRASVIEALRTSAAAADLQSGRSEATRALEQATTAIREAGDLVGRYGHVGTAELQRMVRSHQTPVLHDCRLNGLTPYAAADIYLDFARDALVRAAAGRREVATTLLWLSRTELAHRELHGALADSVAITCLRAAVAVDPGHAMVSNELGYRAMRLGLLGEAQWALEQSLKLQPSEPALQNLIETHRLAGNAQTAQELAAMLPALSGQSLAATPLVVQMEPSQFAAISPPVQPAAATPPAANRSHGDAVPLESPPSPGHQEQPAEDGSVSVLERVASSLQSIWK